MNSNILSYFIACLFILILNFSKSIAQSNHQNPVNNYISFANESTHGMLIAHRILEGFNQEVNKFVDLQSNQFNFYGNKDLPKDLFEDPEHWFYNISPNTWYTILNNTSWQSPYKSSLDTYARELKYICSQVNQIRFTMEDFMNNNDLTIIENQVEIFSLLHHCASLFDRYYEVNDQLHNLINTLIASEESVSDRKKNYHEIQKLLKSSLEKIRYGLDSEISSNLNTLQTANQILQSEVVRDNRLLDMQQAVNEGLTILNNYIAQKAIPEKYRLYGPAYYYYNVELASILNRYGKGFVSNANAILSTENAEQILLLEEPHYFQVILPKKEIPLVQKQEAISILPSKLKEREVAISQTKIQVAEKKVLLEIFDHRKEDGDIISLNFNGRWILKEKELRKSPVKLIVELNETGENYLLLHAENLGKIPPNTIAIRYYQEGVRKMVVLNSDLYQSEMIRIQKLISN